MFGTVFGVWFVHFSAALAVAQCQRARLVPGTVGWAAPAWWRMRLRDFGAGAVECGRAHVKGHEAQRLPLPFHQPRHT